MMSHICFAAWGSIDIEKMDRMQRRNYIRCVREALKPYDIELNVGGQRDRPYYLLKWRNEVGTDFQTFSSQNDNAFQRAMKKALELLPAEATEQCLAEEHIAEQAE
jgi:hypothetical protein